MAVNKSKVKGSAFEAKIKTILTNHFKVKFERVPLSGALKYLKGDIWTMDKYQEWPYCIECKHYAELDFNSLLTAKSNDIFSFWKQATEEAAHMNKKPLLIFRWDRSKDFIAWNDETILETQLEVNSFGNSFKIGLLDDWLKNCKIKL